MAILPPPKDAALKGAGRLALIWAVNQAVRSMLGSARATHHCAVPCPCIARQQAALRPSYTVQDTPGRRPPVHANRAHSHAIVFEPL